MRTRTIRVVVGLTCLIVVTGAVWFSLGWAGDIAFRRGLQAKREWKLAKAVNYFEWARRLQRNGISASLELGICQQLRGDFLTSQTQLQAVMKSEVDDKATLSRLHNAIGINYYSFNDPDAAIASHERALDYARSAGNRRLEAEALIDLSRAFYHSQGKFNEAIANLEMAKTIAREMQDEGIEAAAVRNLGVVYWWFKGELDRPLNEFYFPALELYRRQNDERGAATMLTLIALVYNNKGDIYRFMQYQNESIEIQQRIDDQAGLSDSYIAMGQLYDGIGNYRKARDFYSQAMAITERTGYRLAQKDLRALLAQVQVNLSEYDEAIELYDPSSNHKQLDSVDFNAPGVAYCYQLKGDYPQAISLYERALRAHRQGTTPDVRLEANILVRSAECLIELGDWTRAAEFIAQVEKLAQNLETHSGGDIELAIVRAKVAHQKGNHKLALTHLQRALETEARIFASASTNSLIPPSRRSYERLYELLVEYSISTSDGAISTQSNEIWFGFLEHMRYRSLRNFLVQVRERRADVTRNARQEQVLVERIDKLSRRLRQQDDETGRAQLKRAYDKYENLTLRAQLEEPQFLAIRAASPAALSEVQKTLSPGTALIEFVFAGERVLALAITRDTARGFALPVSRSALVAKTKLFRSMIFNADPSDWLPVAESLHASLIEPIEAAGLLRSIETIGLVPYGCLHELPFAALAKNEKQRPRFLVEDYSLFQIPSATFYAHKMRPQLSDRPKVTIAFGHDSSNDAGLSDLAFAAEEAQAVAQTASGRALINQQATETELKRMASTCDYLHISAHGVAEGVMPLFSRVLLEPTATDDGNLTVREIFELGLHTQLVTLSACETGQSFSASGNDFGEQDRIGLIEAFLHAGAGSVLATLSPVSDQPTTEFMKHFYTELRAKKTKAVTLANTQRAMLRGEISLPSSSRNPNFLSISHPRYWAPFILVGEPH